MFGSILIDVIVSFVAGRAAATVYPHSSMLMGMSPAVRPGMSTIGSTGPPPAKKQAMMVDAASQQAQASLADKKKELRQT